LTTVKATATNNICLIFIKNLRIFLSMKRAITTPLNVRKPRLKMWQQLTRRKTR